MLNRPTLRVIHMEVENTLFVGKKKKNSSRDRFSIILSGSVIEPNLPPAPFLGFQTPKDPNHVASVLTRAHHAWKTRVKRFPERRGGSSQRHLV